MVFVFKVDTQKILFLFFIFLLFLYYFLRKELGESFRKMGLYFTSKIKKNNNKNRKRNGKKTKKEDCAQQTSDS